MTYVLLTAYQLVSSCLLTINHMHVTAAKCVAGFRVRNSTCKCSIMQRYIATTHTRSIGFTFNSLYLEKVLQSMILVMGNTTLTVWDRLSLGTDNGELPV